MSKTLCLFAGWHFNRSARKKVRSNRVEAAASTKMIGDSAIDLGGSWGLGSAPRAAAVERFLVWLSWSWRVEVSKAIVFMMLSGVAS